VVPEYTWKVMLIIDDPGREITVDNGKTLAVWIPNSEEVVNTKWQDYLVAVDEVESRTGYNFFAALPKDLQSELEKTIYTGKA
jgi:endonuclease G